MITSAITIQTHTGTPNTFLFKSASRLPLGLLGDDGLGELGLLGTTPEVPGTAPGELGVPGDEGKL